MLNFRQAQLTINGEHYDLKPGKINSFEHFYVDFQAQQVETGIFQWSLFLHPKQPILVKKAVVEWQLPDQPVNQVTTFARHTEELSGTYATNIRQPIAMHHFNGSEFLEIENLGKGLLGSWNNIQINGENDGFLFNAAEESTGLTWFLYNAQQNTVAIHKDLNTNGLQLSHSFPLLSCSVINGKNDRRWDTYFHWMGKAKVSNENYWCWSTKGCKSLDEIEHGLQQVASTDLPFKCVLIEDWMTECGDWLAGHRMPVADIAALARKYNLLPYLQFPPFLLAASSKIAHQKPEWLLKNAKDEPWKITNNDWVTQGHVFNPGHPGFRDYLSGFFHIALEQWGIKGFCLHELYLASLSAPPEKTRGQMATDALSLLSQLCGKAVFFGENVTISHFFTHLNGLVKKPIDDLDDISTLLSFQHFRQYGWSMMGFGPQLGTVKNSTAANRQFTALMLPTLLSDVLVIKGFVGELSPEVRSELDEAAYWQGATIRKMEQLAESLFRFEVAVKGDHRSIFCNYSNKKKTVWEKQTSFELEAYETLLL